MPEKDISEKTLIGYPDVFANILNVFFKIEGLEGKVPRVEPDDLEDIRGWSFYKASNKLRDQERDVVKLWKTEGVAFCLVGMENQTRTDRYMPLRVFSYEGADYREQLSNIKKKGENKQKKLYPVITIVLYYGIKKRWKNYKNLFDVVKPQKWLKPYVNDCHINILELAWLNEEQEKFFSNDMRLVVRYLRMLREGEKFAPDDTLPLHYQAFLNAMQAMTGDKRFDKIIQEAVKLKKEKGEKTMIPSPFEVFKNQITDEQRATWRKEALAEGREEGRKEGRKEERKSILSTLRERLLARGMSIDEVNEILALH
ncbi:MAG: Rpn family recombination-promoting nuclease/putative transposase [Synergistaceae bacterium]|nr:Rpn family recombination-promoting nuclease/putative transposase [Synergistaceae bacterium]